MTKTAERVWVFKTKQPVPYVSTKGAWHYPYAIAYSYEQAIAEMLTKYTWLDMQNNHHALTYCEFVNVFELGTQWWKHV